MGAPKALLRTPEGRPWLDIAVSLLRGAGCETIMVVLGAVLVDVPAGAVTVVARDWEQGMSASLRAGLRSASGDAALISLVDLPELPLAVVRRVVEDPIDTGTLRQAVFEGRPGHPVLIGRDHWVDASASLSGDHGARDYLVANGVEEIECGDLFDGHDIDR